jgi:hypothetical protein
MKFRILYSRQTQGSRGSTPVFPPRRSIKFSSSTISSFLGDPLCSAMDRRLPGDRPAESPADCRKPVTTPIRIELAQKPNAHVASTDLINSDGKTADLDGGTL